MSSEGGWENTGSKRGYSSFRKFRPTEKTLNKYLQRYVVRGPGNSDQHCLQPGDPQQPAAEGTPGLPDLNQLGLSKTHQGKASRVRNLR